MNYEGEIRDMKLVERLIQLWRDRFTGAIRFENDGIIKIIYFKEGDVLSASTNDRADSVDEILMRAGKVSKEHVKQALAKRKENETLGDALLNLGFITRKELSWGRRIQVINVIRSVEEWGAGSFTIVADYLPKREEGTIFPLPQLVVEMIVTDQDRAKFERELNSGATVFEKAPGQEEAFRKLGLNEDAEAIMAHVDGERGATEVAAASRQETFNAFKLLHALSILGILQRKDAIVTPATGLGFTVEGVADAADAWRSESGSQFALMDDVPAIPGLADPSEATAPPEAPPVVAPVSFPAWDEPPPEPVEEKRWGFDDAQIEASQNFVAPEPPPPPPPPAPIVPPVVERPRARPQPAGEGTMTRRSKIPPGPPPVKKAPRYGLLIGVMAVFILAALGFFGFTWWNARESEPAAVTTTTPVPEPATAVASAETVAPAPLVVTETVPPPPVTATTTKKAPSPPVTGDRARYESMARDHAANPRGNFTVQFAIVCEPSNVTKALRSSGGADVWFTPITLKERSCFRMFWGGYRTRDEADAALQRIPGELRESRPSVVTVPR